MEIILCSDAMCNFHARVENCYAKIFVTIHNNDRKRRPSGVNPSKLKTDNDPHFEDCYTLATIHGDVMIRSLRIIINKTTIYKAQ